VDRNFKKLIITGDQDVSLQVQSQNGAAFFTVEDKIIPKTGKSDSCSDPKRILMFFVVVVFSLLVCYWKLNIEAGILPHSFTAYRRSSAKINDRNLAVTQLVSLP
jgi:hypothetical protein